jgi:hypothetical protein
MSHLERACDAASLFREALGFGWIYGPLIPAHQWNEMSEEKVAQFVARLATPPAQPAPVQPVAQDSKEHLKVMMEHSAWEGRLDLSDALANIDEFYATPPAQPAVPDAIHHTDTSESLEYIHGWNDCRQAMLEMMK